MPVLNFDFGGPQTMAIPDEPICLECATEIIQGKAYPFPAEDEPVKCVVDLGAHAGEFSVMAALKWPQADVFAYEPNPAVWPYLEQNALAYPKIIIRRVAVNVRSGKSRLFFNDLGSVAYSLIRGKTNEGVDVEVMAMSDVMKLKPDVLKLDIEGVELEVLYSVKRELEDVGRIYIEFHGEPVRPALDQLLLRTHILEYCRLNSFTHGRQGEVMYVKR